MEARVSIVVPTWNRKDLIGACLESLGAQTFRAFEVVVVDDGSTDGTEAFLAEAYPDVRVVRLEQNRGFCVAANAGIRAAQRELVFLLNNDMTLEPDCLEKLVAAADASDAAMFGPLVLFQDEPETIYSAGDAQRQDGRPESIGFRCTRAFHFPDRVFGVSAGAGLYRREVFDKIGLFDERFVAYFEDSDLNFRARLAGFDADFVEGAVAYHIGSASLEGRNWWRTRQCCRNHVLLVVKNMPASLIVRYARIIFKERRHQIRRLFSACRAEFGALGAFARLLGTWASIWAALPHAIRERRRIQRQRVLGPDEIDQLLTLGLSYR